ncbi:hypothetical protein G6016_08870 [Dietzia aerolata]|uniref:Uncharacterized protein n=1 Tax=Dietzia aerolata TaxID=595984 RepID=A0ABV5JVU0_9ACTN|nr:hypothetical protein [Dietzia aerolata]MBB0969068.1 hypothetical protein [Dietzia aerolata]
MGTWTVDDLAAELVDSFDIDLEAARRSAEVFLEMLENTQERVIDRECIPRDVVDEVRSATMGAIFSLGSDALTADLGKARTAVEVAQQALDAKISERTELVRRAIALGVPIPVVTRASGLSRARIYQIKADL